jgi:hypothetical protein
MAYLFDSGRVIVFDSCGREIADLAPGIEASRWFDMKASDIPIFTKQDSEWPEEEEANV